MPNQVQISHANPLSDEYVVVEWMLGNTCNYSCSYCPDKLHDGSISWLEKSLIENFLIELDAHYQQTMGKKVFLQLTGGEPTLYPNFKEMMELCHSMGFSTSIITNASRTVRFWKDVSDMLDRVHITYHHESANLSHIKEVVDILSGGTATIHVNFPMIPDDFDRIYQCALDIHTTNPGVSITLKPLRKDFGSELFDYTPEQLATLSDPKIEPVTSFHPRGRMKVLHDDGSEKVFKPNQFIIDRTNYWYGWNCSIGTELLSIDMTGEIYRGVCKVGGSLGSIKREDYYFPFDTVVCDKQTCNCVTDIMTSRYKR